MVSEDFVLLAGRSGLSASRRLADPGRPWRFLGLLLAHLPSPAQAVDPNSHSGLPTVGAWRSFLRAGRGGVRHLPPRPPQRRRVCFESRGSRSGRGSRGAAANPGRSLRARGGWLIHRPRESKKCSAIAVGSHPQPRRGRSPRCLLYLYGPPGLRQNTHMAWLIGPEELGCAAAYSCRRPGAPPRLSACCQPGSPNELAVSSMRSTGSTGWPRSCLYPAWRTTALISRWPRQHRPHPLGACGAFTAGGSHHQGGAFELSRCVNALA